MSQCHQQWGYPSFLLDHLLIWFRFAVGWVGLKNKRGRNFVELGVPGAVVGVAHFPDAQGFFFDCQSIVVAPPSGCQL